MILAVFLGQWTLWLLLLLRGKGIGVRLQVLEWGPTGLSEECAHRCPKWSIWRCRERGRVGALNRPESQPSQKRQHTTAAQIAL